MGRLTTVPACSWSATSIPTWSCSATSSPVRPGRAAARRGRRWSSADRRRSSPTGWPGSAGRSRLVAAIGDDVFGDLVCAAARRRPGSTVGRCSVDASGSHRAHRRPLRAGRPRGAHPPGRDPDAHGGRGPDALDQAVRAAPEHVHVASLFLQPRPRRRAARPAAEARAPGPDHLAGHQRRPRRAVGKASHDLLPHLDLLLPNRAEVFALRPTGPTTRRGGRARCSPRAARSSSSRTARPAPSPSTPSGDVLRERRRRRSTPSTPPAPATPSTRRSSTRGCAASTRGVPAPGRASPARSQRRPSAAPPASRPATTLSQSGRDARCPTSAREIHRQPDAWRRALDLLPRRRRCAPAPGRAGRGDRLRHVVVHGRGLRRAARGRRAAARPTSSPPARCPADATYDRVLAISRSGTTTEVLARWPATDAPSYAITAVGGDPVATVADAASCWTSPTSSRSCRPSSPRRRSCCCAPRSGRRSTGDRRRPSGC